MVKVLTPWHRRISFLVKMLKGSLSDHVIGCWNGLVGTVLKEQYSCEDAGIVHKAFGWLNQFAKPAEVRRGKESPEHSISPRNCNAITAGPLRSPHSFTNF